MSAVFAVTHAIALRSPTGRGATEPSLRVERQLMNAYTLKNANIALSTASGNKPEECPEPATPDRLANCSAEASWLPVPDHDAARTPGATRLPIAVPASSASGTIA